MEDKNSNEKNNIFKQMNSKYRKVKDSINKETGKKVFMVFNILSMIVFLIIIPILFTVMTTLLISAGGPISILAYRLTFYLTWVLLIILFMIRTFFLEYK